MEFAVRYGGVFWGARGEDVLSGGGGQVFGKAGGEGGALSCSGAVGAVWVYDISGVVGEGWLRAYGKEGIGVEVGRCEGIVWTDEKKIVYGDTDRF